MEVHKTLGSGFLESVYQEALGIELSKQNVSFEEEKALNITYKNIVLDKVFVADFVCFNKIIVELKAVKAITDDHRAQVINYLKATKMKLGLLVNFGETSLRYERFVNEQ